MHGDRILSPAVHTRPGQCTGATTLAMPLRLVTANHPLGAQGPVRLFVSMHFCAHLITQDACLRPSSHALQLITSNRALMDKLGTRTAVNTSLESIADRACVLLKFLAERHGKFHPTCCASPLPPLLSSS